MSRRLAPVPDVPPRAVVYVRVSMVGDRQEIYSPEMQEQAARDYCTRRGYTVVEVLTDIDKSGRSWSKRQVEKAVLSIERGDAEVIVTWRWSRFSRNLRDYVIQTARIEAAGGRLEAALEEVDPATAAGLLQRDLFAILAQWESRKIGEAWRETHDRRRREGLPHTNSPRLGYLLVDGRYVPDPETAAVIVECYRRYVAGEGYRQIADWLNRAGIAQPRSGGAWSPKTLRDVMHAGWAAGLIYRHGAGEWLSGSHERLVDERLWKAYRREARRRLDVPPRLVAPVSALSGLMVCSGCLRSMRVKRFPNHTGSRATGGQRRRQATYSCETFGCPRRAHVSVPLATAAVLDWLRPMIADKEISEAVKVADSATRSVARASRDRLRRLEAKLEGERVQHTRLLAQGEISAVAYQSAVDQVAADLHSVRAQLAELEDTLERPAPSRRLIRGVLDAWDGMDELGRNRALRDLVWKVEVSPPLVARGRGVEGRSRLRPFGVWERP